MGWYDETDAQKIVGKVLESWSEDTDELILEFTDGTTGKFYHSQDCCESVRIVKRDPLNPFVGQEITAFKHESTDGTDLVDYFDSATETVLKFTFETGSATVWWVGTSNGYYSEGVSFSLN